MARGAGIATGSSPRLRSSAPERVSPGDIVLVEASPSMRLDLSNQQVIVVKGGADPEEITVQWNDRLLPLYWEDGDRWQLFEKVGQNWFESRLEMSEEPWSRRPTAETTLVKKAERVAAGSEDGVVFVFSGENALAIRALQLAQIAGILDEEDEDSARMLSRYLTACGVEKMPDGEELEIVERVAALLARLASKHICSDDDSLDKTTASVRYQWHRCNEDGWKALEMLVEGYEALGCSAELAE